MAPASAGCYPAGMASTASSRLSLGASAPAFSLPDTRTGATVSLDDFADQSALLVMIWCNHCPYVKHVADHVAGFAREYQDKGLAVVAISANDAERYPADHPDRMKEEAEARGFVFPYLYDESQEVVKAFDATCTPDFYLFDGARTLVYHGRYDDSRPRGGAKLSGDDLRAAVDATLAGQKPSSEQQNSIGCSIKWRPGHRP